MATFVVLAKPIAATVRAKVTGIGCPRECASHKRKSQRSNSTKAKYISHCFSRLCLCVFEISSSKQSLSKAHINSCATCIFFVDVLKFESMGSTCQARVNPSQTLCDGEGGEKALEMDFSAITC
ncbi:MAG: hypothetical protein FWG75_06520 [Cystobacterineae bacterium]|nr:hypothetical protein [Cystobacterineae bacterium]